MGMTPQEIQEKHFHDTFRGYSHEEVDLFLDEVAVAFERLYRENQSFMRRVVDLEEQLKRVQESAGTQPARTHEALEEDSGVTESTLKRMLLIAQETADRAVQEARQRAREIQEQARARADEMMEHAEKRVRELSSQRMEKEKELERAKEALRRFDQQYRASFRVFIESQLEALKDLPATPQGSEVIDVSPEPPPALEPPDEPAGFDLGRPATPTGMETVAMPVEQIAQTPAPAVIEPAPDASFGQPAADDQSSQSAGISPETPAPQWEEGPGPDSAEPMDASELVVRAPKNTPEADSGMPKPAQEDEKDVQSGPSSKGRLRKERRGSQVTGPADSKDAEEDRLIRELFWGEED